MKHKGFYIIVLGLKQLDLYPSEIVMLVRLDQGNYLVYMDRLDFNCFQHIDDKLLFYFSQARQVLPIGYDCLNKGWLCVMLA